ncbi:SDR family oxidoreductase [Kutzneria buriramensis]|uniref:NADP-dependent 3-hydroxy acid dehydrogenase YdfG n=1 Tax=Kutzneria buriramensis TaxID=1045776 RepID=A0A3E0HRR1_9PSEU|nr:SDR family oxidoreductase [Kutzneria buriramensis]REH48675.1 NADP-dependent 3-hydroxy acid dehydrogenase YdfG [Kutzneria buriramensis]
METVKSLEGRVAVITGASSGIGEAAAEHLAELGARVVVLARRADRLGELVTRIEKNGGQAVAIAADVSDAASVQAAADRVLAEFGGADLLFNNAGVMLPAPVDQVRADLWQQEIDTNVTGLMNAIGAFVPQLIASAARTGVADLINTSSIGAQNIYPNFAVYAGTKAFVTHSSRQLRAELGSRNVRVSVVEPGLVRTELQGHVTDPGANAWLDGVKDSLEWLVAEDIARTVGFIATLPRHVNIQQITVMPTAQAS